MIQTKDISIDKIIHTVIVVNIALLALLYLSTIL
jgi:hypothetical protein